MHNMSLQLWRHIITCCSVLSGLRYKTATWTPPLSSQIVKAQMQLAMETNEACKGRDERAIRWLISKLADDSEIETLASSIPGSFDSDWGLSVWMEDPRFKDASANSSSTRSPPPPPPKLLKRPSTLANLIGCINRFCCVRHPGNTVSPVPDSRLPHPQPDPNFNPIPPPSRSMSVYGEDVEDLCQRIRHLFETCDNHDSFTNDDEWRKRSRVCVEAAAPFIFRMDADISAFGDIRRVLSDLGNAERTRDMSSTSLNWSFISCWTRLSIVLIRKLLDSSDLLQKTTLGAIQPLLTFYKDDDYHSPEMALKSVRRMDEQFVAAWRCVEKLRVAFKGLSHIERRDE